MVICATIDSCTQIGRALDDLAASAVTPPGLRGAIYAVIDHLRGTSAPAKQVEAAERIALSVHQLDWAILKRDGEKEQKARQQLSVLRETWGAAPEA